MANERTIPILPCRSINEMLTFYTALGFDITYQQTRPNTYACVQRGGIDLHFFVLKGYDPAASYSTCYVHVNDADALYKAFVNGLRQNYEKLPTTGIPRITPLRDFSDGERRFNIIDPGGNWIRIGQTTTTSTDNVANSASRPELTKLSRAIEAAILLSESTTSYAAAAKVLDTALKSEEAASTIHTVRALILRAGLAITMNNSPLARHTLSQVQHLALTEDERTILAVDLQRAADLQQEIELLENTTGLA